jgi:hypothetical protein
MFCCLEGAEWREDKKCLRGLRPEGKGLVPEGRSDRSLARSAWTAPPQKSRPVGYGMIRAGMRTDSMIGMISLP